MSRLIDADAAVKKLQEECDECMLTKEQREIYCSACGVTEAMNILRDAPAWEPIHACHHRYKTYGAYDELHHEPTEEEQLEIKRSLAEKLLPALIDELQVVRCHYPAGERCAEDPRESWTYGVKFTVCHECGKRDIDCEDKSFEEHGITAMKKAIGIEIPEHYVGEPGEVIRIK